MAVNPQDGQTNAGVKGGGSLLDNLERLAALRAAGHLSEEEFADAKRRLGIGMEGGGAKEDAFEYHTVEVGWRKNSRWAYMRQSSQRIDQVRNQMAAGGWEYVRDESDGSDYQPAKLVFRRRTGLSSEPPPVETALGTGTQGDGCFMFVICIVGLVAALLFH